MNNIYTETILDNVNFNIIKKDNAIIINLKKKNNLLISSWLNGGYQENIKHVINQSLTDDDYDNMVNLGYKNFQIKRAQELGLDSKKSTGLTTSACMDNYGISTIKYKKLTVTSLVTAGADKNGIKAGDPASFYEYNHNYQPQKGTINIFTYIDANIEPGALVTATITATEAKTTVLQDLKIESQFSENISTGTGTDGICIISNKESENHIENTGKHSKLGELIAKTIQNATRTALDLQTFMNPIFQKDVLSRLERFHITYDTLYKKVENKYTNNEFASYLYPFIKNPHNVAWISSVLNLIDEVKSGLLSINEIKDVVIEIIVKFTKINTDIEINTIDDILNLLSNSILYSIVE